MSDPDLKVELERAYRALRGLYGCAVNGRAPDKTMLAYHSLAIGASLRFVNEGALDGTAYFIGKPASVLHDVLATAERSPA